MNRRRVVPALLSALATCGVALPFLPLFAPNSWLRVATAIILVVGAAGVGLRHLLRSSAAVVAGQLVLGLWALLALTVRETLWYAVPTPATAQRTAAAVTEFAHSVAEQAAPVETTPGVVLALGLVFLVLAVVVDALAVTRRMPAAAGLPLLTAFVAAASNSSEGLSFTLLLLPSAAWMGLLAHDGTARLVRWGSVVARPRDGQAPNPTPGILAWARAVGVATILAAVALPQVLPHLPARYLADGLARGDRPGNGTGASLEDTLAVAKNLGDRSDEPILRYQTGDANPPPLRVDVLSSYQDGVWRTNSSQLLDTGGQLPANEADPAVPRRSATTRFTDNGIAAPQFALPGTPLSIDLPASALRLGTNGVLKRLGQLDDYTVRYEEVAPSQTQLRDSDPRSSKDGDNLVIDEVSADYVAGVVDRVAPADLPAADQAWRIQAFLRGPEFTYSLRLADRVAADGEGRPVPQDPVSQFLATRRGYCVQFATAMAMMARHRGIPARVAIGFLPGTLNGREWTVRAADAHAWPELHFPGIGWVRFEPTPGVHTGQAPGWTTDASRTDVTSTPSASASTGASARATDPTDRAPETQKASRSSGWRASLAAWVGRHAVALLLGTLVLAGGAATPMAATLRRRRALRHARDDAERTEILWQSLLDRLSDVDVHPGTGDTPRQARATLERDALLDASAAQALTQVVDTLERARYAAPGADLPDITSQAETVARNARERRRPSVRLRARLWPHEGRRVWAELFRR